MRCGKPSSSPSTAQGGLGETRCVTPRQTCPRPEGFGRNLRSKTRWFTGFCNSHQVSHFATFFIDARAEISVAESRLILWTGYRVRARRTVQGQGTHYIDIPWRIRRRGLLLCRGEGNSDRRTLPGPGMEAGDHRSPTPQPCMMNTFSGQSAGQVSTMILPQVHLRKPCYDFTFL